MPASDSIPAPRFVRRAERAFALATVALLLAACMRPVPTRAPLALAGGTDASGKYAELMAGEPAALSEETLGAIRECRMLVVRGFLTDTRAKRVMADQIEELGRLGVERSRVEGAFDSEAAPRRNADAIADAIAASDKPVLLLTHSKGSIDTLVALIERPEIRAKVRGWISLDAPMQGSPVADYFAATGVERRKATQRARRSLTRWALASLFSGDPETIEELSTARRVEYLSARASEIEAIAREIPIVCYGSIVDSGSCAMAVATRPFLRAEPRNDGLVPIDRAALPYSIFIQDPCGPDHRGATIASAAPRFDRKRQLRALLAILCESPRA